MLLILEGVDGVGKSTLANQIVERHQASMIHFPYLPEADRLMQWTTGIVEARKASPTGAVVVDRLHHSERAYGPLVRGVEGITDFENWVMEGWLLAHHAKVIFMKGATSVTLTRLEERYGGLITVKQIEDALTDSMMASVISTHITGSAVSYFGLDQIASVVQEQMRVGSEVRDDSAGEWGARTWFVGFQHNLNTVRKGKHLPESCFSDGCAQQLYRALKVARISWKDMHLSNAYDDADQLRDLETKYWAMNAPRVVALGNLAAEALEKCHVPYNKVEHPSHARRFRRHDVLGYARELKEAAGL